MKKINGLKGFVIGLFVGATIMVTGTAVASNVIEAKLFNVKVIVDGQELSLDDRPLEANGRTYLPVRALAESLGYKASYSSKDKVVSLKSSTVESSKNTSTSTSTTKPNNSSSKGDDVLIEGLLDKVLGEQDGQPVVDLDKVKQLIEVEGVDVNAKDKETGLSLAAIATQYELFYSPAPTFKYLKQKGADLFATDNQGRNLMHLVVFSENGSIYSLLLEAGVDRKHKDNDGKTPFDYATEGEVKSMIYRMRV